MALIDRVLGSGSTQAARASRPAPPEWLARTGEAQRYEIPNGYQWDKQAELYQRLSWVNIAVTHVANTVATTPLRVKERQGERLLDIDNHPLEELLDNPNPRDTRFDLLFSIAAYRALTGNAYLHMVRPNENAPPVELWPIPAPRIHPVPDGRQGVSHYMYNPGDGEEIKLKAWEVLHTKRFHPRNQYIGLSPIEALATVAIGDMAMQKWNTAFFDKDHAKPSGVLGFQDLYAPEEWQAMKDQIRQQYGGTNRALMLLQGLRDGGVTWIANQMSQRDMEFLLARQFNKEEILAVYAPGLANVLDVNATEANAEAGRKTFKDAVWVDMVAIASSITHRLLPAYGDGLAAEFDDIRITDRALELQEIDRYAQTHTLDEVRERYYNDDPIGDERGEMLYIQISKGQSVAVAAEQGAPQEPEQEARDDDGGPEPPEQRPEDNEPEPPIDDDELKAARDGELSTWRRYAHKHGAIKAAGFSPDHLPEDVATVIKARLAAATDDEEVSAAFVGPFLVKAAREDAGGNADPHGDSKDTSERRIIRMMRSRLDGQMDEVLELLGDPPDLSRLPASFWETQAGMMVSDLRPQIESMAQEAVLGVIESGVGIDWTLAAAEAADWASSYAYDLVRGLNGTTQTVLRKAVTRYIREGGRTIGDLRADLEPYFGRVRAEMIAVTETTRAYAEGERIAADQARRQGLKLQTIWRTNKDDMVCTTCRPLDGTVIDSGNYPPAHVRCRCWATNEWVS